MKKKTAVGWTVAVGCMILFIIATSIGFRVGSDFLVGFGACVGFASFILPFPCMSYCYNNMKAEKERSNIKRLSEYIDVRGHDIIHYTNEDSEITTTCLLDAIKYRIVFTNGEWIREVCMCDVIECQVISSEHVIQSTAVSDTLLGGMVGGAGGALIGNILSTDGSTNITSFYIRFVTKDPKHPIINIILIEKAKDKRFIKGEQEFAEKVYAFTVSCLYAVKYINA